MKFLKILKNNLKNTRKYIQKNIHVRKNYVRKNKKLLINFTTHALGLTDCKQLTVKVEELFKSKLLETVEDFTELVAFTEELEMLFLLDVRMKYE